VVVDLASINIALEVLGVSLLAFLSSEKVATVPEVLVVSVLVDLASVIDVELDLVLNVLFDEDEFGVQMVTLMGADFPIRLAGVT